MFLLEGVNSMITLPALIGEHSCGGWSCQFIYILGCLYSNLCKFFHSPLCPSIWWGVTAFKALTLHRICWDPVVSLEASQSLLPPWLQWCLLYNLIPVGDFAQQALLLKLCSGNCCGPMIKAEDMKGTDFISCWAWWVWSHISPTLAC